MADLTGQTVDQYRLDRRIGEGTTGTVYQSYDLQNKRTVAVKVIHKHLVEQDKFKKQFLMDMPLLTVLQHPNIARIYRAAQEEKELFLVTEYVEGGNLQTYMQKHIQAKTFPPLPEAIIYGSQIADGMHYAHDQRILHQNMKPENVLLKPTSGTSVYPFQMLLTDLGLKQISQVTMNSEVLTTEYALAYLAPEVYQGHPPEQEADIYAVGVILYLMSVRRLPFNPRNLGDAMKMVLSDPVPPPTSVRPGLPKELERIILKCLEKVPDQRYQTASKLSYELKQLQLQLEHKYPTVEVEVQSGQSTHVNFETQPKPEGFATEPEIKQNEIGRDRLVITSPDTPVAAQAVNKNVMLIGRDPSADIVLQGPQVSRYHARIELGPNGIYQVMDLGSTNGVWIGSMRLRPNRARNWYPGEPLRVGTYRLTLEPAASLHITQQRVASEVRLDTQNQFQPQAEQIPLNLIIVPPSLWVSVDPGGQQSAQVQIVNESRVIHQLQLQVKHIPPEWVKLPDIPKLFAKEENPAKGTPENLQAPSSDYRTSISIGFNPPRASSSLAGVHPFELILSSDQNVFPVTIPGQLNIEPFYGYTTDLRPVVLKNKNKTQFKITNNGNTVQTYTILARDEEEGLKFFVNPATTTVDPGQTKEIPITLTPKFRQILGNGQNYRFEVSASDGRPDSDPEQHKRQGEVSIDPRITQRNLWFIFLLLGICGLTSFCSISQLLSITARNQDTANTQGTAQAQQNATGAVLTVQAVQTAAGSSDIDGDGLTNAEEAKLGTNPNLSDTDGDGLSDGQEVKQFGTNPVARDTDNDSLSDGAEVNSLRTSPNNPDTDGDGLQDNVDPDPLQLPTITPPPAPTAPPAG